MQSDLNVVQSTRSNVKKVGAFGQTQGRRKWNREVTYLNPSGDVRLHLDVKHIHKQALKEGNVLHDPISLVVSSKVLCLANPLWRAMLKANGHFKEAILSGQEQQEHHEGNVGRDTGKF